MPNPDRRWFTLRDAMILVAATAAAFALTASSLVSTALCWNRCQRPHGSYTPEPEVPGSALVEWLGGPTITMDGIVVVLDTVLPLLMLETPTVLALRLCRPRPPWRALVGQPGAVGCGAATAAMVTILWVMDFGVRLSPAVVGGAVGAAWLALAAVRGWRSEPSWVDRSGRILGGAWLVTIPVIVWFEWHA
jgi:hypothetical protein